MLKNFGSLLILPLLMSMSSDFSETARMSFIEFMPRSTYELRGSISPQLSSFWDCNESMYDLAGRKHKFHGNCRALIDVRYGVIIQKKVALSVSNLFALWPYRLNANVLLFEKSNLVLSTGSSIEYYNDGDFQNEFGYGFNLALEYKLNQTLQLFTTMGLRYFIYNIEVASRGNSSGGSNFENEIRVSHEYVDNTIGLIFNNRNISLFVFELGVQNPVSTNVHKEKGTSLYKSGIESSFRLSLILPI